MSPERVLSERKGKVIPCWWTENRKGAETNSGESGARNLEAETKYQKRSGEYGKVCKVVRMILHNTGCICTPQHRMNWHTSTQDDLTQLNTGVNWHNTGWTDTTQHRISSYNSKQDELTCVMWTDMCFELCEFILCWVVSVHPGWIGITQHRMNSHRINWHNSTKDELTKLNTGWFDTIQHRMILHDSTQDEFT